MTWINSVLSGLAKTSQSRRVNLTRLRISELESREVPAVVTWTGALDNFWSNNANWSGNAAPMSGDDLVFPGTATSFTTVNDFAAGTSFASISISSAGFVFTGNAVTLTGPLSADYASGTSLVGLDATLGSGGLTVSNGASLDITGALSGTSGLTLSGGGVLTLLGTGANSYTGTTVVNSGTLALAKSGGDAFGGDLNVASGATARLLASDQVPDSALVTLGNAATFDLNEFNDTVGGLNMTGATVATGTGTLTLNGDVTSNSSSATSVIAGNLDLGGATRSFTVANNSQLDPDLRITANISGTGAGITKLGANSQLYLSGNNTYDGATTISAGAIEIASDNALGSTAGGTVVSSGYSVALLGNITTPEPFTISGVGFGGLGAIFNGNGNNTITGPITLNSSSTLGSLSGNLTISGVISDGASSFALTKVCAGTVTLTSANTYDGGTSISNGLNGGGVLAISNGSALGTGSVSISNGNELDLSNDITLSRNITFQGTGVGGNGALRSVSGNNTYSGTATVLANDTRIKVDAGQLEFSGDLTDGGNSYGVDKHGAGVLLVSGNLATPPVLHAVEGDLRITGSNSGIVTSYGGTISGTGTVGGLDHAGGSSGTVDPGTGNGTTGTLTTNGGYQIGANGVTHTDIGGTTAGSTYDQIVSAAGGVDNTGSTLQVSLVGGFVPAIGDTFTIIDNQAGGSVIGAFNGLAEGATFQTGIVTCQVSYVGGTGNDVTLTVVGVTSTWTGLGGDSNWSTAANWDTNQAPAGGEDLVFPAGAARLSNTNDLSGKTFHSINIAAGGYDINGNAVTLTNGMSASFSSNTSEFHPDIALTATATVDVVDGGDLILSGAISGFSHGITKTGGGTLEYTGFSANTYTGATTVDGGTLILNRAGGLNAVAGSLVIGDGVGADSVIMGSSDQIADGAIVSVASSGTLDLGGNSDMIGGMEFTGGTITTGSGTVTLASGGSITSHASSTTATLSGNLAFDGPNNYFTVDQGLTASGVDLEVSAIISSLNNIIKDGSGTLAFSAANTYGGGTNINSGVLAINHDTGAGTGVVNILGTGTLDISGGITANNDLNVSSVGTAIRSSAGVNALGGNASLGADATIDVVGASVLTVAGTINDSGNGYGLVKDGTGSLVLAAANSYSGGTTASAGFLVAANGDAFGDPAATTTVAVQSGASLQLVGGITLPATKTIDISGVPVADASKIMSVSGNNTIQGDIAITGGNNVAFDVAPGTTLTVDGVISGSRDFDKNNSGTLILNGTNTNTGNVNVGDGTLIVNGSLATSNSVFVDGVVGGSGVIPAVTLSGIGTLNPGSGPGVLHSGDANFTAGSTFAVELNGATVGTQYDQLDIIGTVTLSGTTLSISAGFTPMIGDTFTIINNDGSDPVSGTFNGLAEGSSLTVGPVTYTISYAGGTGNDVVLTVADVSYAWTGAASDRDWTNPGNWAGNVAPTAGSRLIFPANPATTESTNNFPAGMVFHSVIINGSGYDIYGNGITLDNGITATFAAGSSSFGLDTTLTSTETFDIAGGTLDMTGIITVNSFLSGHGVIKEGGGTLRYSGSSANLYNGTTTVNAGALVLAKSDNVTAANGSVIVGNHAVAASVVLQGDNQFWPGSTVTVNEGSTFDVGGHQEFISILNLQGATTQIDTGGVLKLFSMLTTSVASNSQMSNVQGLGALELVNAGVNLSIADDASQSVDLRVSTIIQGSNVSGGFFTSDHGVLALSGNNTFGGDVTVGSGAIQVESNTALGTTAGGTTVASGASVYFSGASLNVAEDFTDVAGSGVGGNNLFQVVSGDATLTGAVTMTGSTQVGAADGATLTLDGVIDDGASTCYLEIINGPTGRTVLGGSNLFDGALYADTGFIRATDDNAFGDPSASSIVFVGIGGSLELAGGIAIPPAKSLILASTPVMNSSKVISLGGDNSIAGPITLINNNQSFDVAPGTTLTVAGDISGSVDFDKNGPGTLVLTGTNTNTGNVNVGDGTLIVSGSLATSNSVFVDGTLGGSGTLPAVTISSIGSLAPGAGGPGVLNTGNLAFSDAGSAYRVELNGTTAGTQYDQLDVTGTVTLSGTTLSISAGFTPMIGDTFTIINNDGSDPVGGTFNGLAEGSSLTVGPVTYTISYVGGDGNDVVLTVADVRYTWTGADNGGRDWTLPGNWDGNITPTPGSHLIFPANPVRTESINNFSPGTIFHSVTIDGAGYDIYGNGITLRNGITTTFAAGSASFGLDTSLTAVESFDIAAGGTLDLSASISGAGVLNKHGAGTLLLSGTSNFAGLLNAAQGILLVNGTLVPGSLTVVDGALAGTGTLSEVSVSGTGALVPGNSGPGIIHSGNIAFVPGATLSADLNGTVAGTQYDQLDVTGTVTLGGATLNLATGFTSQPGDVFTIVNNDGVDPVSGTFDGLSEGASITIGGTRYRISYVGGTGNDVTLTCPENSRPVIDSAPVIIVDVLPAKATVINGAPVSRLTANITDADPDAWKGIAITAAPSSATTGRWEFSADGGAHWTPITGVSATNALLLADVPLNRVRFVPSAYFTGFASLKYTAWDTTTDRGTTGTNPSYGNPALGRAYGTTTETATTAVGKTTPMIDASGTPLLTSILKDSLNPSGDLVSALLGTLASDPDKTNVLGLAITSVDNSHGIWQFQIAGKWVSMFDASSRSHVTASLLNHGLTQLPGTWVDINSASETAALLLGPTAKIRFLPDAGFFGRATIGYHAWDQTVGQAGELAVVSGAAFSTARQSAIVNVIARPVLDISVQRTLETPASTAVVGAQLADVVSDVLPDTTLGIAVTGTSGSGTWTYQIGADAPVSIKATLASAVLLPANAVLKFTPAVGFAGVATLNYRAWNATTQPGAAGSVVNGSGPAFSLATETLSVYVAPAGGNARPVAGKAAIGLGNLFEDSTVNPGVSAGTMIVLAKITDADKRAIVVTGADNTNGMWQYSTDGRTWRNLDTVDLNHALALEETTKIRFVPAVNFHGTATIQFKAWDGTIGSPGDYLDSTAGLAFGAGVVTGTLTVKPVNDSPVLGTTASLFLPFVPTGGTSADVTVATLAAGATDVETAAGWIGIAVRAATGPGKWKASTNGGTTFTNLTTFPTYLPPTAILRFVGDAGKTGLGSLSYQAWDGSSVNVDSMSLAKETLTVAVGNQSPTLSGPGILTSITEDQAVNLGDTVANFLGATLSDLAVGKRGIAITGVTNNDLGVWQRSLDAGKTWVTISGVSDTTALLLPEIARIRFLPAANLSSGPDGLFTGNEPTITYKAWDQTVGMAGETIDTLDVRLNSFSAPETARIIIRSVFDAPMLDTIRLQTLDEAVSETVDALLDGVVSSPESLGFGIAVTGMTGNGVWEFSADNFATPGTAITGVNQSNALLLSGTTSIRFIPASGFAGVATLKYKAWDSANGLLTGRTDTTATAVSQYFSTAEETLSVNVGNQNPVLNTL